MKKFYRKLYKSRLSRNYIMVWLMIYIMKKLARTKIRLKATYEYSCTTIVTVISYLNYYRSITKFRNNFANAVFSDSLQLNFKTIFHLYTPILCSNKDCFLHHYYFGSLISMDILSERDLFNDHSYYERYISDKTRSQVNHGSKFRKSFRICSKNDDDKSSCYALA